VQKTVVSITPLAVETDSRTLKIARSLARFGYRSIIVEGVGSRTLKDIELPVVSLSGPAAAAPPLGSVRKRLRGGTGFSAADAAMAAAYRARYFWNFGVSAARRLPMADLYYLHAYTYAPAVASACRRNQATFIYDAHDFYPDMLGEWEVSDFERRWLGPFFEAIEQRCCTRAASVVTVSDGIAALISERFHRRPVVIRNAHDLRTDRRPARDIRAVTGVTADDRLIVLVGNAKAGQATSNAIAALARLPGNLHLAFVGTGYEAHAAEVAALGLGGRVHLVGRVPPDAVVPFVATADAAAILYYSLSVNYRRALPNKFFQAIAAGLPLFYPAELDEIALQCRAYGFGIAMDPRSVDSLVAAFNRLLTDPAAMGRERETAARMALDLNWAREEDRLAKMLASLNREPLARAG
jgi:glycosyltransferase involved in cell wall biosynthesis